MVDRSIDADRVVACLDGLLITRGAPAFVRFDKGPEFIANAVADWCRFNGVGSVFIDPGSPWQNAEPDSAPTPSGAPVLRRLYIPMLAAMRSRW